MPAADQLKALNSELDRLEAAFRSTSRLQMKGSLGSDELEFSVEAFALRAVAAFESFLREHLVESVAGGSELSRVSSYIRPLANAPVRDITYGGERRAQWLPLKSTIQRAHRLLRYGQPFCRLELRQLDLIDKARVLRNAIAHDGEEAREVYEKRIMQGDQSFARPARWLLFERHGDSNMEKIVARLRATATALAIDKPDLDLLLGPPTSLVSGAEAPAGRYRCSICGTRQILPERARLIAQGTCKNCQWGIQLLYGL